MPAPANPYNTVARDDFDAMVAVDRYARRSSVFDEINAGKRKVVRRLEA